MSEKGSDADDERGEEKDEEESSPQKYESVISALPPKVVQQEESQVEVSASPAFQTLDEVCNTTFTASIHVQCILTSLGIYMV